MKIRLSIVSLFFALAGTFAHAAESTLAPRDASKLQIASGSAMLVDLQTNKVIYSSNPDVVVPIASVSKLMTGLIVSKPSRIWTSTSTSTSPTRPR